MELMAFPRRLMRLLTINIFAVSDSPNNYFFRCHSKEDAEVAGANPEISRKAAGEQFYATDARPIHKPPNNVVNPRLDASRDLVILLYRLRRQSDVHPSIIALN